LRYLWRGGRLAGYCAMKTTQFSGTKFLALIDAVFDPECPGVPVAIRRIALGEAISTGSDILFAMFNPLSRLAARLTGFPFLPLPTGLMRHPPPIFVLDIDRSLSPVAERNDGYFVLADLDYF
jgi:hypothetical protein